MWSMMRVANTFESLSIEPVLKDIQANQRLEPARREENEQETI
jgi:hypothetical protein